MLDQTQVCKIVNEVFEGVDKSIFGPMFIYTGDSNDISERLTQRQLNQVAFGVYTIVLTAIMRNMGEKCLPV